MVFFLARLYFVSVFCDVVQLSEQRGVHLTASFRVTAAILHIEVFHLVGDAFTVCAVPTLEIKRQDLNKFSE